MRGHAEGAQEHAREVAGREVHEARQVGDCNRAVHVHAHPIRYSADLPRRKYPHERWTFDRSGVLLSDVGEEGEGNPVGKERLSLLTEERDTLEHCESQVPDHWIGLAARGTKIAEASHAVLIGEIVHRRLRDLEARELEGFVYVRRVLCTEVASSSGAANVGACMATSLAT